MRSSFFKCHSAATRKNGDFTFGFEVKKNTVT